MATHECTWYNLDMLRKGFSAVALIYDGAIFGELITLGGED